MLNLKGKSALVTGGSKGIGLAVARRLAQAGANVAICGRSEAALASAVQGLRLEFSAAILKLVAFAADVREEDAVRNLFLKVDSEFGGLDILVNNAGVGIFKDLASLEPAEWKTVIETNLNGAYLCSHQALSRFRARQGGWIVNVASLASKNSFAGGAAYNASKFGLLGFSEAIMLDHRYEGVRVSTVLPGSVSTDFGMSGRADWKIAPEDVAEVIASILAMPDRTLVSHVEIRPSRPKKP
ncbi:MAG: short-chain dehydrogenase [Candidatus Solibacter sp.]|nr:short-chain dehydrogenase [Candidatus Solibacter sp.]